MPTFDILYEALKELNLEENYATIQKYAPKLIEITKIPNLDVFYNGLDTKTISAKKALDYINNSSIPTKIKNIIPNIKTVYEIMSSTDLKEKEKQDSIKLILTDIMKRFFEYNVENDTFNNIKIIFTKSPRMLKKYGEGSYWCVAGRLGRNSQDVKDGKGQPGDWVTGRANHFLNWYFQNKNYSYYWAVVIDENTNQKYLAGLNRNTGDIIEFRTIYDKEVDINNIKSINELKNYIKNKFLEFKKSSAYSETLVEDITQYDGSQEGWEESEKYYSHVTCSPVALYNILSRLDKEQKASEYNFNTGVNGTVSFSNQFIKEPQKDATGIPACIKRNKGKFLFGIVIKKEAFKNIKLTKYHDLLTYFKENELKRLRVTWIFKTKQNRCYIKIYLWPDVFEVTEEFYEKVKRICLNQPFDKNIQPFNIIDSQLGHLSKKQGGKLTKDDVIEAYAFKTDQNKQTAGPALSTDIKYKDLTKEEAEKLRKNAILNIYVTQEEVDMLTNSFQGDEKESRSDAGKNIAIDLKDVECVWFPQYYIPKKGTDKAILNSFYNQEGYRRTFDLKYLSINDDFLPSKNKKIQADLDLIKNMFVKIFDLLRENGIKIKFYDNETIREI